MAYGNWGAFVYKNGVRQTNREDNTPYKEDKLKAGYCQAFLRDLAGTSPVHASLGQGEVRLCGYKSYPQLFFNGREISLIPEGKHWGEDGIEIIQGEIKGYKYEAEFKTEPNRVILKLTEPDGTIWTGVSGFELGAGHDEDDTRAERLMGGY